MGVWGYGGRNATSPTLPYSHTPTPLWSMGFDVNLPKMSTRILTCLILALAVLLPPLSTPARGQDAIADPDSLFRWSFRAVPDLVAPGSRSELRLTLELREGHLVYRDRTSIQILAPEGLRVGDVAFPPAHRKLDPTTGETVDAYAGASSFEFIAPVVVSSDVGPGPVRLTAEVRFQGCSATICYLPARKVLGAVLTVGGPGAGREGEQ